MNIRITIKLGASIIQQSVYEVEHPGDVEKAISKALAEARLNRDASTSFGYTISVDKAP